MHQEAGKTLILESLLSLQHFSDIPQYLRGAANFSHSITNAFALSYKKPVKISESSNRFLNSYFPLPR